MGKFITCLSLLLFFGIFIASPQIPDGYYSSTQGLNGIDLQWELYNIIKDHKQFPYTSTSTDVWDILKETDRDTINPNNVICIYSGLSVNAAQEYNGGNGWTREHVWAKSRGDFGTEIGAGTDVHHLRPSINDINTARSNRWFAECNVPVYYNNKPIGSYTDNVRYVWKPRDEVKGDIARMIFYMATRYKGKNNEPNLTIIDYLPVDNYTNEPVHALLSDLLLWHNQDPVNEWERNRNNVIYSYQKNRNPFIDHPEFVERIWGSTNVKQIEKNSPQIYPNPANTTLNIDGNYNNISIYNNTGKLVYTAKVVSNVVDLSQVENGVYIVMLKSDNKFFTSKLVIIK